MNSGYGLATMITKFKKESILMREFYASDDFKLSAEHTFYGVICGWNGDTIPVDTLAIGSLDDAKFSTAKFQQEIGLETSQGLSPIEINASAKKRPAKVFTTYFPKKSGPKQTFESFVNAKKTLGYTDSELAIQNLDINQLSTKFAEFVRSQMPLTNGKVHPDQPIHIMDLSNANGNDSKILTSLKPLWKNIRYLRFEDNKTAYWGGLKFFDLISDLKASGLVCYWEGSKESKFALWRITDCFLNEYHIQRWASVACVNVLHDDVKELASRVEAKFLATIRRTDILFDPNV